MRRFITLLVTAVLLGTACYHAKIETGASPATQTIEKPWASGWLFGLVPPSQVETTQKCASGVAQVETQHSFLNMVAAGLTLGIYTPITIKVTCAGRTS